MQHSNSPPQDPISTYLVPLSTPGVPPTPPDEVRSRTSVGARPHVVEVDAADDVDGVSACVDHGRVPESRSPRRVGRTARPGHTCGRRGKPADGTNTSTRGRPRRHGPSYKYRTSPPCRESARTAMRRTALRRTHVHYTHTPTHTYTHVEHIRAREDAIQWKCTECTRTCALTKARVHGRTQTQTNKHTTRTTINAATLYIHYTHTHSHTDSDAHTRKHARTHARTPIPARTGAQAVAPARTHARVERHARDTG
jgi:hypothetical protein